MVTWPALLDALEERAERAALLLQGEEVELPDIELAVDGPLPEGLRLRAAVLVARTEGLERQLHERRLGLVRAQAYASH
jgi:hypothetical protein